MQADACPATQFHLGVGLVCRCVVLRGYLTDLRAVLGRRPSSAFGLCPTKYACHPALLFVTNFPFSRMMQYQL
jgi:hypothetical protein